MQNNYAKRFLQNNSIQVLDVLVVERLDLGIVNRFVPFVGYDEDSSNPLFVAQWDEGVFYLEPYELQSFFQDLRPTRIKRFQGTDRERDAIFNAINGKLDINTFNLILNWTEGRPNLPKNKSNAEAWAAGLGLVGLGLIFWGLLSGDD